MSVKKVTESVTSVRRIYVADPKKLGTKAWFLSWVFNYKRNVVNMVFRDIICH